VPDLTHRKPVAEQVLRTQPSHDTRVLTAAARLLDMDADAPMTELARRRAMDIAADSVLRGLPVAARCRAFDKANARLPKAGQLTRGQYATCIRDVLKETAVTDRPSYRLSTGQTERLVDDMLREMADCLEQRRPDEPMTAVSRIALIQATTMTPSLARALRAKAPEITGQVVRREYAAQLRQIAGEA
jgi:hypothetical protein